MNQTAFLRGKNGEYRECLKYSVPVFVEYVHKMQRLEVSGVVRLTYRSLGVKGLNNVRQHNCFIIQGSYIGWMFRLIDQSSSGLFSRLSHKVLCTHWDPSAFKSIKYVKSDQLPQEV